MVTGCSSRIRWCDTALISVRDISTNAHTPPAPSVDKQLLCSDTQVGTWRRRWHPADARCTLLKRALGSSHPRYGSRSRALRGCRAITFVVRKASNPTSPPGGRRAITRSQRAGHGSRPIRFHSGVVDTRRACGWPARHRHTINWVSVCRSGRSVRCATAHLRPGRQPSPTRLVGLDTRVDHAAHRDRRRRARPPNRSACRRPR